MKTGINLVSIATLATLLLTMTLPLIASHVLAAAEEEEIRVPVTLKTEGNWAYIQNDKMTMMFPANGSKPMFLWWSKDDLDNINVVKYKGLVEYVTYNQSYFVWKNRADAKTIKGHVYEHYLEPSIRTMREHPTCVTARGTWHVHQVEVDRLLGEFENQTNFHTGFLPFSACKWELSVPVNVSRGDVKYLSFNFTLVDVPGYRPHLQFAENNVIIRCRFYYTPATENVEGKYSYTVEAGELKMDLVIKHWEWNIDRLEPFLPELNKHMVGEILSIPMGKAGLALWVNLAAIDKAKLDDAGSDAEAIEDMELTEASSTASSFYVEAERVSVTQNRTGIEEEHLLRSQARERHKFRFETNDAALVGFFKFVPQALVRNATTNEVLDVVDVAASYVSGYAHMRVFLGYPYFGNNTLEHDPSLGLEAPPTLIELQLLTVLLIATTTVAGIVVVVARRRKTAISLG